MTWLGQSRNGMIVVITKDPWAPPRRLVLGASSAGLIWSEDEWHRRDTTWEQSSRSILSPGLAFDARRGSHDEDRTVIGTFESKIDAFSRVSYHNATRRGAGGCRGANVVALIVFCYLPSAKHVAVGVGFRALKRISRTAGNQVSLSGINRTQTPTSARGKLGRFHAALNTISSGSRHGGRRFVDAGHQRERGGQFDVGQVQRRGREARPVGLQGQDTAGRDRRHLRAGRVDEGQHHGRLRRGPACTRLRRRSASR